MFREGLNQALQALIQLSQELTFYGRPGLNARSDFTVETGLRLGALCLRGVLKEPGITAQATAGFSPWWPSAFLIDLKHYESRYTTTKYSCTKYSPVLYCSNKILLLYPRNWGGSWLKNLCWEAVGALQGCDWESWF